MEPEKTCSRCLSVLPLDGFYKCKRHGQQAWCKKCSLASVREYQARVGKSVVHRSVRYGLSRREVRSMLYIPTCQSCGVQFPDDRSQKFDHCHTGGHFRGVICHACNMACQGTSEQAIVRLRACIEYLTRDIERACEQV